MHFIIASLIGISSILQDFERLMYCMMVWLRRKEVKGFGMDNNNVWLSVLFSK